MWSVARVPGAVTTYMPAAASAWAGAAAVSFGYPFLKRKAPDARNAPGQKLSYETRGPESLSPRASIL
jgi:hypothetical protein